VILANIHLLMAEFVVNHTATANFKVAKRKLYAAQIQYKDFMFAVFHEVHG